MATRRPGTQSFACGAGWTSTQRHTHATLWMRIPRFHKDGSGKCWQGGCRACSPRKHAGTQGYEQNNNDGTPAKMHATQLGAQITTSAAQNSVPGVDRGPHNTAHPLSARRQAHPQTHGTMQKREPWKAGNGETNTNMPPRLNHYGGRAACAITVAEHASTPNPRFRELPANKRAAIIKLCPNITLNTRNA